MATASAAASVAGGLGGLGAIGGTGDQKTPTTYRGLPPSLRTPSFPLTSSSGGPLTHRYTPGGSLHGHEFPLVLEIGTRFLRAGFSNDPVPKCVIPWDERLFRRAGERVHANQVGIRRGKELWRFDFALEKSDGDDSNGAPANSVAMQLRLVEDMLERGLSVVYNKWLLIDSKTRKIVLPVPPLFPTRLLSAVITTIFTHFQPPSLTLLSSPVLATIAAGLRSALVVDIGWYETVVTPVYELRAIEGPPAISVRGRSGRGIKLLVAEWTKFLVSHGADISSLDSSVVEEVMERCGWCQPFSQTKDNAEQIITIPLSPSPPATTTSTKAQKTTTIQIPFSSLSDPAESTFFGTTEGPSPYPDDHDFPIPLLLFTVLRLCTVDVRAACLPRIVIVGGGSRIPGIKKRIVEELKVLVEENGWNVSARNKEPMPVTPSLSSNPSPLISPTPHIHPATSSFPPSTIAEEPPPSPPPHLIQHPDPELPNQPRQPEIRGIKSLGVWTGGCLWAGLEVKEKTELEREKFLAAVANGGTGLPTAGNMYI